eukprot:m.229939 g.229939  ORF g.229939 m.229939 type:complete len:717 (-) comp33565_c0_seq2:33-2183(-)
MRFQNGHNLIVLAALSMLSRGCNSRNYYIDSRAGNDGNAGSSVHPWQSLAKLMNVSLEGGDVVLLARGAQWRERMITQGGSATQGVVTYSSYGPPQQPKPLIIGSINVTQLENWQRVEGVPGQWRTYPRTWAPASDAVNVIHNGNFSNGMDFWGFWNENPQGFTHVSSNIDVTGGPLQQHQSLHISFRNMSAIPQEYTQIFSENVSIVNGNTYNLSFWFKASTDINMSGISLFSMSPPYTPYGSAAGATARLLRGGSGWSQFSIVFVATATVSDARFTWHFDNRASPLPDMADVWFGGVTASHVVARNPNATSFDVDVGNLLFWSGSETTWEPSAWGVKKWLEADVIATGDFFFNSTTNLLTTFCLEGSPGEGCWPGGIEAALDVGMMTLASFTVVDGLELRYGAANAMDGSMVEKVVVKHCDISWIGGGVLCHNCLGRKDPVRYGNGIQFWMGAVDIEVFDNRIWQIYDTPLTNQGQNCTHIHTQSECAMRNISYHHNLASSSGMACVEVWYQDNDATMDDVRFENNICANIGDGGWSATQRPDPAGRSFCSYGNPAATTSVSIRNNIFFQTSGFEALLYVSDHWDKWAAQALTFDNNVLYRTATLPIGPSNTALSTECLVKDTSDKLCYTASNFSNFTSTHAGMGARSVLGDPRLHGLTTVVGGAVVNMLSNVTSCHPLAGSPVFNAGASVKWLQDFDGNAVPQNKPSIGPYQV